MSTSERATDVLISGAGGVGLLLGVILNRMGVNVHIIDKKDKRNGPMYGRAISLYPRTLEFLEQLGILEELEQIGVLLRANGTFDHKGQRVPSRGWNQMFKHMESTYLKYVLNIRLYYTEETLEKYLAAKGVSIHVNHTLKDLKIDAKAADGYKVTATVETMGDKVETVKCKFIVGCDGANSTVQQLAGIHRESVESEFKWIRVDGLMTSNIPDQELPAVSVESPTHGNTFFTKLDHGRRRVGFAVPLSLTAKYGDKMTEEEMKYECKQAMEPFKLEFQKVDWWTLYTVRQGLVDNFYVHDCVLLAGDACHTHSSSAAQGLNTGIGDAMNLGWKLGGVIRGWYDSSVLQTYHTERRAVAEELVRLDKWYSTLINNKIPTDLIGASTDPNVVFSEALERSMQFTIGLGIGYDLGLFSKTPAMGQVEAGLRAPDALVYRPGNHFTPLRLLSLTPNWGCFWVIIFAGQTLLTRDHLVRLHEYLDGENSFAKLAPAGSLRFLTVVAGFEADGTVALGGQAFGKMYQDWDHTAHLRFGVPTSEGAIVVVRPDSYMGFATTLDQPSAVEDYFSRFMEGFKPDQATNGAINGSTNGSTNGLAKA